MKLSIILLFALSSVAGAETITYDDHVQELFGSHCSKCHNADKKKGDLDLMSYSGLMAGSASGPIVVAGNPKDSMLYLTMTHEEEPTMPPKKDKLPQKDLDLIFKFIQQGVKETSNSKALVAKKEFNLDLSGGLNQKFEGPGVMPKNIVVQTVNLSQRGNAVIALAHSPRSPLVAIGGLEQVVLYNSDNGELQGVWPFQEGYLRDLRFTPNGKVLVASGGQDGALGKIVAWDVENNLRILEIAKEFETLFAASLSSDLKNYASSACSSSFKIGSVSDKNDVEVIKKHTNWLTSISYSPDGILLATGDRDGGIMVWESHSKQRLYSFSNHKNKISKLSWSPDSNLLLSASEDGELMIWNMINGSKLKSWKAHNEGVLSVDISNKGQIATSGRDKLVKLWDSNGKLEQTIKGFEDLPLSVKFNHDGEKLITGDWLGNIKAWDVKDAKELKSFASYFPTLPKIELAIVAKPVAATPEKPKEMTKTENEAKPDDKKVSPAPIKVPTVPVNQAQPQKEDIKANPKAASTTESGTTKISYDANLEITPIFCLLLC